MMPRISIIDEKRLREDTAMDLVSGAMAIRYMQNWDTHIPIPTNETQFKRCPQVELLIAMPVGASKFYPEASSKVVSWGKSARKRGGGRYAIRQRTEDGVHGVRIWRTA